MFRAIIKPNSDNDARQVTMYLTNHNFEIVHTSNKDSYPEYTILVKNLDKLNELVYRLNQMCSWEVQLIKTEKASYCDGCPKKHDCSDMRKKFNFLCDEPRNSEKGGDDT